MMQIGLCLLCLANVAQHVNIVFPGYVLLEVAFVLDENCYKIDRSLGKYFVCLF